MRRAGQYCQDRSSRIPPQSHRALSKIRAFTFAFIEAVLRRLEHHGKGKGSEDKAVSFECR
jgi:hypothetical protein